MLYPAFLARNRMATRVLAKTTKVKNNFIDGKKTFKRILSCLFGGRRKVQVTNLPSRTSSLLSVVLRTRSVQRLRSQHLAAVLTPNLAELVTSGFILSTTMVFAALQTHFPRKNTHVYRNTVTQVTCVTSNPVEVHRLNLQHLAMVRASNMAEPVPSGIFYLQPWFCSGPNNNADVGKEDVHLFPHFLSVPMSKSGYCSNLLHWYPLRNLRRKRERETMRSEVSFLGK